MYIVVAGEFLIYQKYQDAQKVRLPISLLLFYLLFDLFTQTATELEEE